MAKVKKVRVKKEKVKDLGPKPKWRPWMTIMATIGGVSLVSGATVLGVFLTGGFAEKIVSPESISFSYDEKLFNTTYSQLEITDSDKTGDFQLVITSPTEHVTQKKVELSFDPQEEEVTITGEYISNTIIQVPRYVTIGQPFSVKLLTEILKDENGNKIQENGKDVDWIKGGISTLYAQSENLDVSETNVKIAVDTPVYKTQTIVYDSNGDEIVVGSEGINVLAGESFTVDSLFIPAKSEYMYSDDSDKNAIAEDQRRMKHSFYEPKLLSTQANAIIAQYDSKYDIHFTAANKLFDDPVAINAYTFKYADTEIEFFAANEWREDGDFYRQVTYTLSHELSEKSIETPQSIVISEAAIGEFLISSNSTVNLLRGNNTKIYIDYNKDQPTHGYFGAKVYSNTTPPRELENMLRQVGVRFTLNGKDATTGDYKRITINNSQTVEYDLDNDGTKELFYLPYSGGASIKRGYWDITALPNNAATEDETIKMEMVLFTNTDGENADVYKVGNTEIPAVIDSKKLNLTNREPFTISWNDASEESIILQYTEEGFAETVIDLEEYINYPKGKEIVFFAHFTQEEEDEVGGINRVFGKTSYSGWKTLEPNGTPLKLYILNGNKITLYNTGKFELYFAAVNPLLSQDDENYIELWCNEKKEFSCQKALFDGSVTAANIKLPAAAEKESVYYSYVGAPSADENQFTVEFIIDKDSYTSFSEALNSGKEFAVKLYNSNRDDITHLFEIYNDPTNSDYKNPALIDLEEEFLKENPGGTYTGEKYAYRIVYKIKDSATINQSMEVGGKATTLVDHANLLYNVAEDGSAEIVWGEANSDFEFKKELYVYNAKTEKIEVDTGSLDPAATITVNQVLGATGFDDEIKQGGNEYELDTLIANMATKVTITDQHNNTSSLEGKWLFKTSNENVVNITDDKKAFVFGTSEKEGQSVEVSIVAEDNAEKVGATFALSLTTTGIDSIEVKDGRAEGTTLAIVEKNGVMSPAVNIQELVKFKLADGSEYTPNEIKYSISSTTISGLRSNLADLFGSDVYGGWILMKDSEGNAIYADDNTLTGGDLTKVATIQIQNYFGVTETINIQISATGVNTTLRFVIRGGADEQGNVYGAAIKGDSEYSVYAGSTYYDDTATIDGKHVNNTITRGTADPVNLLSQCVDPTFGIGYIIEDANATDGTYILAYSIDSIELGVIKSSAVGEVTSSYIKFYDFWETDVKTFNIRFTPDGENYYAAKKNITFNVYRDLKIKVNTTEITTNKVAVEKDASMSDIFYIYNGSTNVSTYIKAVRATKEEVNLIGADNCPLKVVTDGIFLDINEEGQTISRTDTVMSFDEKEELSSVLYIKFDSTFGSTILATINLKVKLHENLYQTIATSLTHKGEDGTLDGQASVQEIDGIKYIVVDTSLAGIAQWEWNTSKFGAKTNIKNQRTLSSGEKYETLLYSAQPENENKQSIQFNDSGVLYGYKADGQYMILNFSQNSSAEWIYIPMIVSSVGTSPVQYKKGDATAETALKTALMTPDELIKAGIYDEYLAGEEYLIHFANCECESCTCGEECNSAQECDVCKKHEYGLKLFAGVDSRVEEYQGPDALNDNINNALIADLVPLYDEGESKAVGFKLSLVDLADNFDKPYYIALKYDVSITTSATYVQSFYYLIKVLPSVHVENPLYPYYSENKPINYENIQDTTQPIVLDKPHDSKTLQDGKTRFNVSYLLKYDSEKKFFIKNAVAGNVIRFVVENQEYQFPVTEGNKIIFSIGDTEYTLDIDDKKASMKDKTSGVVSPEVEYTKDTLGSILGGLLEITTADAEIKMILQGKELVVEYGDSTYSAPAAKDIISNVTVNDGDPMTSEQQWSEYITISVVDGVVNYTIAEKHLDDRISFTVKRSYVVAGTEEVQIIDGSHEYVFVLNDNTKNYSVRFIEIDADGHETKSTTLSKDSANTEYVVDVTNGSNANGYTLKVLLIENAEAGSASSGTVVRSELDVKRSSVVGDTDNIDSIGGTYDPQTGEFKFKMPDYISKDTKVSFTAYTSLGYEATLTFNVKANASVAINYTEYYIRNELNGTNLGTISAQTIANGDDIDLSSYDFTDGEEILFVAKSNVNMRREFIYAGRTYRDDFFDSRKGIKFIYKEGVNTISLGKSFVYAGYSAVLSNLLTVDNTTTGVTISLYELDTTDDSEITSYISLEGDNLKLKDITEDKYFENVPFKVTFSNDTTFSFAIDLYVAANVAVGNGYTLADEVVAGAEFSVYLGNFFLTNKLPSKNSTGWFDITLVEAASSSAAFDRNAVTLTEEPFGKIKITPKYVPSLTPVQVELTFKLNSGEEVVVSLDYTVAPAVKIVANYPNPTGEAPLLMEYMNAIPAFDQDGDPTSGVYSISSDALAGWIKETALFAEGKRFAIYAADEERDANGKVTHDNEIASSSYPGLHIDGVRGVKLTLTGLNNAKVFKDCWYTAKTDGNTTVYVDNTANAIKLNEVINNLNLIFMKGDDSSIASTIEISAEYCGYVEKYVICLAEEIWTAQGNYATNNTISSEYDADDNPDTANIQVQTEKIYLDKTNTSSLFKADRMAKVAVSTTATAGENYLVYSKQNKETHTITDDGSITTNCPDGILLTFSSENENVKFTYEGHEYSKEFSVVWTDGIEVSISGYVGDEFFTSYETLIASYPVYIKSSDLGKVLYIDLGISVSNYEFVGTYPVAEFENNYLGVDDDRVIQNMSSGEAATATAADLDKLKATNVFDEVVKANRIQLFYGDEITKYQVASEKFTVTDFAIPATAEEGETEKKVANVMVGTETKASYTYYYQPSIDIEMQQEASAVGNYITLTAGAKYKVSETFGLIHPTTGLPLSPADGEIITLNFEVAADNDSGFKYKNHYTSLYASNLKEPTESFFKDPRWLSYGKIVNQNDKTFDFEMTPQGAKNDGDFVLVKITYGVNIPSLQGVTKTYYVVVKIMPDYVVSYGGDSSIGENDGGIMSNKEDALDIKTVTGGVYDTFILAGDHEEAYFSIKHMNGTDTSLELSVANFKIKMYEADNANLSSNLTNKLKLGSNSSWTLSSGKYTFNTEAPVTFSGITEVVFGDQSYFIEGTDGFGYVYRVYFTLQVVSGLTPISTNEPTLKELGNFDLGVEYRLLQLTLDASKDTATLSSDPKTPEGSQQVPVITLGGIDAWLFANQDATVISNTQIQVDGTDYDVGVSPYLTKPKLGDIKVGSILIYDSTGTQHLGTASGGDSSKPFATTGAKWTDGTNTIEGRPVYKAGGSDPLWTIPRIDGEYFGSNTSIEVQLQIKLVYGTGTSAETTIVIVKALLNREVSITATADRDVYDGTAFNVADQFTVVSSGAAVDADKIVYYNDTLEVLTKAKTDARMTLTWLANGGGRSKEISITVSNDRAYAYTNYISLSEKFGVQMFVGDQITISKVSGVQAFYYNHANEGATPHNTPLTDTNGSCVINTEWSANIYILPIESDYIYVENSALIENSSHSVTKYYIVQASLDDGKGTSSTETYYYTVNKNYKVSGVYKDFKQSYTTFTGYTIDQDSGEVQSDNSIKISYANWSTDAFTVTPATGITAPDGLKFKIVEVGVSLIGVASFDDSGNLILTQKLQSNEYIAIDVFMAVSGTNRDLTDTTGEEGYLCKLGTLVLGPKQ